RVVGALAPTGAGGRRGAVVWGAVRGGAPGLTSKFLSTSRSSTKTVCGPARVMAVQPAGTLSTEAGAGVAPAGRVVRVAAEVSGLAKTGVASERDAAWARAVGRRTASE